MQQKRTQIRRGKFEVSCGKKPIAQKRKGTAESGLGREMRNNQEKPSESIKQTSQILSGLGKS